MQFKLNKEEGNELWLLGYFCFKLYSHVGGRIQKIIRWFLLKFEGGHYSITLRKIFLAYHHVNVGMYTRGPLFNPASFPPGSTIGRYCSIHGTAQAFGANHPMNTKSAHAFFYNPLLGYVKKDLLQRTSLTVGNDVFIGYHAIITSSVSSIGDGAIIGAGAVVFKDVPPYAIVVGNPARVVRYRFSDEKIAELIHSRWWKKSLDKLLPEIESFQRPLDGTDTIR